jgi:cysteine desulfurase
MSAVYLDYAASTPIDPVVADAMDQCQRSVAGGANASAVSHAPGREAAVLVERAAGQCAALIGADPAELVWVSGATEADNLAIVGAARFRAARGRHIVTALNEHPAVLESCRYLERNGYAVTYLRPDEQGLFSPDQLAEALRRDTILVSLMHVNNETGVYQDIAALGEVCRDHGALFHVDAAQSAGRLAIDVRALKVDLLSLSAHKMYGPKGIGVLFLDADRIRRVEPLLHGGGQQRGLRPGTLPTAQIVGMGRAAELAAQGLAEEPVRVAALRDRLWQALTDVDGLLLNGHPDRRACHILNFSVTGVAGESLLLELDGLALASGSACASATDEPSPGLRLLGRDDQLAQSSLRISLGRGSDADQVDYAAAEIRRGIKRLRAIAEGPRRAHA